MTNTVGLHSGIPYHLAVDILGIYQSKLASILSVKINSLKDPKVKTKILVMVDHWQISEQEKIALVKNAKASTLAKTMLLRRDGYINDNDVQRILRCGQPLHALLR